MKTNINFIVRNIKEKIINKIDSKLKLQNIKQALNYKKLKLFIWIWFSSKFI